MGSQAMGKICFLYRRWIKSKKVEVPPEDVKKLFKEYSENDRMSRDQLRDFLKEYQREIEDDACKTVKIAFTKYKKRKKYLSLNGFFHFLLGDLNHPLNFQESESYMGAPLAHYFWHTGYDSYLYCKWFESVKTQEDQPFSYHKDDTGTLPHFGGGSINKSIMKALTSGVRVIELELDLKMSSHQHQSDFDVQYKGTTSSFKKCLGDIKENAFFSSHYPVIIILVNLEHQVKAQVIKSIKKIFGDQFCSDITFASPQTLKGKFIILTRNPEKLSPNDKNDGQEVYEELIPLKDEPEQEHSKFNPSTADLVSFTQKNLLGVYLNPKGTGISSLEYNPLIGWAQGVQMVACNTHIDPNKELVQNQKRHLEKYIEKYVWIIEGIFRAYGGFGYIKKPDILLSQDHFDPNAWRPVKMILKVKVYMGTGWHLHFDREDFDPTSPPDFFAAIEIVGVPGDEAREKTLPEMDQWIPKWNQEFKFPLTVPELAFLMIKVSEFDPDRTHDFGGQTCLPVSTLRTGIRSVPLFDMRGRPYQSVKLLMRFELDFTVSSIVIS